MGLLAACKEKGLHTIIETAGDVPWESLEAVVPYTDQFFYDVKLVDNGLHRVCTGRENIDPKQPEEACNCGGRSVCADSDDSGSER